MKIAIMMRAIDQPTGFRSYMEGVVSTLLRIDQEDEYLLLYRKPDFLGRFSGHKNVKEMLIGPSHVLLWDQVAVPLAARREGADVIFNPKFTVPLLTRIPTAMVVVEPIWWATPGHHPWWDVAFMHMTLPLYLRKARHFLPWSEFMIADTRKYLKLPLPNATVTYTSVKPHFKRKIEPSEVATVRAKYGLPERYILCVANVLLKAYKRPVFRRFQERRKYRPRVCVVSRSYPARARDRGQQHPRVPNQKRTYRTGVRGRPVLGIRAGRSAPSAVLWGGPLCSGAILRGLRNRSHRGDDVRLPNSHIEHWRVPRDRRRRGLDGEPAESV